jgi:hypothetical protein
MPDESIDRKEVAMGGEDFWILARLPRRRRFEIPITELKRSQKPKRPPEIKGQHIATYLMEPR